MNKLVNFIAYFILILTIGFNLYLYSSETTILADPNDNIFQYSLVYRTNWVWNNYGCPFSPSCLPNLIDHNVTTWAEGYPLPFYYSHVPQIAIVSSYHLFIQPLTSIINTQYSMYNYYNLTKYLLLCLFPLSVFLALRLVGFPLVASALGAFFSSHFSTDGLYGIDPTSFLWRGYGLTSQLYAQVFLPLGLAFFYRSLRDETTSTDRIAKIFNRNSILASIFLTLTTAGHLGIGIIGLLSTLPFLLLDLDMKRIILRMKKMLVIYITIFIVLSYWIIPILLTNQYHIISSWDPIWKFNSYGWYEVVRQFLQGEIFDWQRIPSITLLVTIGFFVLIVDPKRIPFALLFLFWMLMYFGRTTWGGLIDLIPGMKDFHQHRFIVGIHAAALFLIPTGIEYIFQLIGNVSHSRILVSIIKRVPMGVSKKNNSIVSSAITGKKILSASTIIFFIIVIVLFVPLSYFTVKQTVSYATLNNKWIKQSNDAYLYDDKNAKDLIDYLSSKPQSRVYAGRPGNWGRDFRLGSTEMYMLLGVHGFDMTQFLPETWSPLSENEQNFDERAFEDFDLLNIKYLVAPKNEGFADAVKLIKKFGPFELYEAPTTGWFTVVTSPMSVTTDKTNYINLVHLWHVSYPRRYYMHPVISVEKRPTVPFTMRRNIHMTDEVTYTEDGKSHNIFTDFPFVFPDATVSAKIVEEKVTKQTYAATIDVPTPCDQCMIMFKMSYHPDWQVKLDGKKTSKYAVFPYYLATPAIPGRHTVEFTYEPNQLKVVLLGVEIILGVVFVFRKKIFPLVYKR